MKLPFTLGIKLVFRILLPGFFLALGFLPVLRTIVELTNNLMPLEYVFALAVLILGWLIVILDMPIYIAFEGRRYWPEPLRSDFISREKRRLEQLERIIKLHLENPEKVSRQEYIEASVEIRQFPINDNDKFEARFPTRLGNLLTAYEEYSRRIYGMWQGFYWSRLWFKLDKDLREEIDNQQALADSALYTVTALYVDGVLCSIYAILYLNDISFIRYLPRSPYHLIFPFVCFVSGYAIYRLSLHVHAQFGETFKSVFDQFGQESIFPHIVKALSSYPCNSSLKTASLEEQNMAVWFYLHNNRVKCSLCGKVLLPNEAREHVCESKEE